MELSKIETLIEFVGRSNVTELTVTERGVTVRIFRNAAQALSAAASPEAADIPASVVPAPQAAAQADLQVKAPVFGVLHRAPAPGEAPFVKIGDMVEEGQTLFIIEAMKVFNTIAAPRTGRIARLTDIDGGEVETGEILAEIA